MNMISRSAISEAFFDLLKERDPIFPALYEINFLPTRYVDRSWIRSIEGCETIPEALSADLLRNLKYEEDLNRFLLSRFEIEGHYILNFDSQQSRLCYMHGEMLHRIILYLGAMLNAHWMSKVFLGKEVALMKSEIGEDVYLFAIKRLPFLFPKLMSRHPMSKEYKKVPDHFYDLCIESGLLFLYQWFLKEPEAVVRRFELKLPVQFSRKEIGAPQKLKSFKDVDPAFQTLLLTKLIKEILPEWIQFFQ